MNAVGRTLPHSLEAEECLLSACLLDGTDVVARCIDARIRPESFYDHRHGLIFGTILNLHARRQPLDVSVVAVELSASHQIEAVGGIAFLTQVSSRILTTAQASYFVEKVRSLAARRDAVRIAQQIIERCHDESETIESALSTGERELNRITNSASAAARDHEMSWDELMNFDPRADADCLMGQRYLCRSGGAVIVAPSGVGKSVLSVGLGCCAALGRPFFGIRMTAPMRVLYVQAEDDTGDVSEALKGFLAEHKLSLEDLATLRSNLRIVRWNDAAGDSFLSRLRSEFGRHPWDLVIINPLFSFCGCSVSEQSDMSRFLRNGLNPILNDTRSAAVIVHHTNKPPADGKERPDSNTDLRYAGSGSSELTNWARAYVTLQPVKGASAGLTKMVFAKRGNRAGIVDENGQSITTVQIQHSKLGLCWVAADPVQQTREAGRFAARFDIERARDVYDPNDSWDANEQAIAFDQNVSRKTVSRRRNLIETTSDTVGKK